MIDPQSSKTTGFHLLLQPEGRMNERLLEIIEQLATEYGGPVFPPHITLLARIPADHHGSVEEISTKAQKLADSLSAFTVTLGHGSAENTYFRSIYLHIKEQTQMRGLHAQALEIFSMTDESPYLPHLSLLYGNYSEEQKRKTIESLTLPAEHSFEVKSLHLYQTEGEVRDWKFIKQFSFGE
ncbi:hypothetical protein BH11PAT2_BH11PAT2_03300 [soil metagenome]